MTRIILPFIDANIVDATVIEWKKNVGDAVAAGELVVEVTTDKAAFEVESPASGTLLAIYAPAKSVVPVKYILGVVGAPGEEDAAAESENAALVARYRAALTTGGPARTPPPAASEVRGTAYPDSRAPSRVTSAPRLRATPKARRRAQAKGIDIADVQKATGAEMITEAILEAYLAGGK